MVAPSFKDFEMLSDPYVANGKMYIRLRNPKTGTERVVRWYTNTEYAKLYPTVKEETVVTVTPDSSQKLALGFEKGYITIFKGDTYAQLDWFHESIARYAKWWGWYIISTEEVPADLPASLTPVVLKWESVGLDSGSLKPEAQIKEAVDAILYSDTNSSSEYIGSIGERREFTLTVDKNILLESQYGKQFMHIFSDVEGNVYVWTTAAKCWPEGDTKRVRATIKDHRLYKGVKQTVLTRATEL